MEQSIVSSESGTGDRKYGDTGERSIFDAVWSSLVSAWQKIRAGIWRVETRLSSDVTQPVDVERIIAHLGVVKRAEDEGRRDLPPSGEDVPTGMQREIIAYFSGLRRRARQRAENSSDKLLKTLEELQNSDSLARLRDIPAACDNRVLRHVADAETRLHNVLEHAQSERQHYDAFRQKNALDRVAQYAGPVYRYMVIVPTLMMIVAFALANAAGSLAGGDSGVSTIWIVAASVASVLVPFMLGDTVLRWINHVSGFISLLGLIGAVVALAIIAAIAFYTDFHIAHVLANPDAAYRDVFEAMLAAPLDVVSSIANLTGFGLAAIAGLLAMLLAYHSDDPYPGYGAVQRRYFRARDARDELFAQLRTRVNGLIDESEAEIDGLCKDFKRKVRAFARQAKKSERNPAALRDYDAELEDACNIVLDRYRKGNSAARSSESPLSFAEHVCFNPDNDLTSGHLVNGRDHVADLQTMLAELEKDADLARQKLRDLNVRMINSIAEPQIPEGDAK